MAAKKTSDAKTAELKTDKAKKKDNFPQTYIKLRTVLDALEINALRYCLKDTDEAKRIKRAEEIIKDLMPIIEKYQGTMNMGGAECGDGFFRCNGCCIPYPCPY